jgi:protocatechuate 3,4-dioxygenase beta subunit
VPGVLAACQVATRTGGSPSASAAATSGAGASSATASAAATSATCSAPLALTPAETEGPYFKAGSPERTSLLEAGMSGTKLVLTGRVLSRSCAPIARAGLDFWQADASGNYDNAGYRLRGHQLTDDQGNYRLETVVPGEYPGRTQHIHFKAQAPGKAVLTSQLYLPGSARNGSDSLFLAQNVITVQQQSTDTWSATFDFVLDA